MMKLQLAELRKRSTRLQFEATPRVLDIERGETHEAPEIGEFLDEIVLRLGPLPSDTCAGIRRELRTHLENLIAAHEELGATRDEAVAAAIRQLGDPTVISRRFQKAWQSTAAYQNPFAAMRIGLAAFSLASAALLLIVMIVASYLQFESGGFYFGPPEVFLFLVLFWMLPILAGVRLAVRTRTRAALGSFLALSALAFAFLPFALLESAYGTGESHTVVALANSAGIAGWGIKEACVGGCYTFVLWLPIGCMSAAITAHVKTRRGLDKALV